MRDIPRLKAEFFKALGHPLRIRVLELLSEGDQSVSELLEHVTVEQPYLSQQLAVLRRAGFVVARTSSMRWPTRVSPSCSPCRGRCCWTWSRRRGTS
jgi:DNA-binding transcriptional ArsR family regulator